MTDLKPCPFCGEPAELDINRGFCSFPEGALGHAVAIYCTVCGADMTMCRDDFPEYDTDQLAAILEEAWNKRTQP